MGWAAIIAAILEVVGPLLKKWLADWLENLLKTTAAKMGATVEETDSGRARALLTAAYESLWWFQFGKRRLLLEMLVNDVPTVATTTGRTLSVYQRTALAAAADAC